LHQADRPVLRQEQEAMIESKEESKEPSEHHQQKTPVHFGLFVGVYPRRRYSKTQGTPCQYPY
jgi:hypothetical protein